jgi:plasmid stabilization system protein ParE
MTLRFTARARRHLNDIAAYIADKNPRAAAMIGGRIREVTRLLEHFPYVGREGTLQGTREMVVPGLPYVIVYRIPIASDEALVVLGIYHAAQRRPGQTG